jgi:hypothetical protein
MRNSKRDPIIIWIYYHLLETIKLRGNPDGKHLVIDCGLNIYGGNWILTGWTYKAKPQITLLFMSIKEI